MLKGEELKLISAIRAAELFDSPFPSLYFRNVFPSDFYQTLLNSFPAEELYREMYHPDAILPSGRSSRKVFELHEENFALLDRPRADVWRKVLSTVTSPDFAQELFLKLTGNKTTQAYPKCALTRDSAGFFISPHPDWFTKLLTVQLFLPSRFDQAGLGTTFYDGPEKPLFNLPFTPNTGYAFAVSNRSWHGRDRLPTLKEPRNTLSVTFYAEKGQGEYSYHAAAPKTVY